MEMGIIVLDSIATDIIKSMSSALLSYLVLLARNSPNVLLIGLPLRLSLSFKFYYNYSVVFVSTRYSHITFTHEIACLFQGTTKLSLLWKPNR
jgi:hypothetical protein